MGSSLNIEITIKPITSEEDFPRCAQLSDEALKPDGLHEFKARYGGIGVYKETIEKLTKDFRENPATCRMFKAVISLPNQSSIGHPEASGEAGGELIVGFTHWHYGYLHVPKMDPFAIRRAPEEAASLDIGVTSIAVAETSTRTNGDDGVTEDVSSLEQPKPFYSNPDRELARKLGNIYIRAIRGKRHVCEL